MVTWVDIGEAVLWGIAGWYGSLVAAKRTAQQPVLQDRDGELELLELIRQEPELLRVGCGAGLRTETFTYTDTATEFTKLCSLHLADGAMSAEEAAAFTPTTDTAKRFVSIGERLLNYDFDRSSYLGQSRPVAGDDGKLRFQYQRPSALRQLAGFLFAAVSMGLVAALDVAAIQTAALGVVAVAGVVLSFVDRDTLIIDNTTWLVSMLAGWGLLGAAVAVGEMPWNNMAIGAVTAGGWFAGLWMVNVIFKRLRGIQGIGSGDPMVIALATGVPTAVFPTVTMGMYSVVAGMGLAAALNITKLRRRDDNGHSQAFALGPFLAVGWSLITVLWVIKENI